METLHKSGGGQEQELINLGGFWRRSVVNEYGNGFQFVAPYAASLTCWVSHGSQHAQTRLRSLPNVGLLSQSFHYHLGIFSCT